MKDQLGCMVMINPYFATFCQNVDELTPMCSPNLNHKAQTLAENWPGLVIFWSHDRPHARCPRWTNSQFGPHMLLVQGESGNMKLPRIRMGIGVTLKKWWFIQDFQNPISYYSITTVTSTDKSPSLARGVEMCWRQATQDGRLTSVPPSWVKLRLLQAMISFPSYPTEGNDPVDLLQSMLCIHDSSAKQSKRPWKIV